MLPALVNSQTSFEFIQVTSSSDTSEACTHSILNTNGPHHIVVLDIKQDTLLITAFQLTDSLFYRDKFRGEHLTRFFFGRDDWHKYFFTRLPGLWEVTEIWSGGSTEVYDTGQFTLNWVITRKNGVTSKYLESIEIRQIMLDSGIQLVRLWHQPR